jgi:hypothetical protein
MRFFSLPLVAFCLLFSALSATAAPLSIVANSKSNFQIVIPKDAPRSVQAAARELQTDIELATGVKLKVVRDDDAQAGSTPSLSLGATAAARKAGVLQRKIADEGFAILSQGGNIFIWGPDTPDGQTTAEGGTSNGTANGVYTFLEDYLDVRWLMPGELGRDVPRREALVLPDVDRTEAPFFINRREPYIQNTLPTVQAWQAQQKLGYSFRINHGHNFEQTVPAELYKEHPDWFPMIGGKRPYPTGRYKLETTNPELVKFFAERAIEALKANPQSNTYSLSPSDSRGWSESPESKALYDPPPAGSTFPSVTPMILKFYRDVAQIVEKEYPQGKLAGYIYADYLFPPKKGGMTLPDNFYPVVAPSINYGYTLYRPDVQQQFREVMQDWARVTPHLFYYDLPNTIGPSSGLIIPAAPEILNTIFPILTENNVKGVYIYGTDSWSNAAMANTILAKMMWNPKLDARQLQHEWLTRAYGPQAGAAMEKMYDKLDDVFRAYYRANDDASYSLNDKILSGLFAPHYVELEKLFLQAKAQPMTPVQKQRLQLLEDNFIVLQWRLRNKKLLPADFSSPLQRDNDAVIKLLFSKNADFELFPGMVNEGPNAPAVKVQIAAPLAGAPNEMNTVQTRNGSFIALMAPRDGQIKITPRRVSNGSPFVSYALKDAQSQVLASGVLQANQPVIFEAKAQTPYFLAVPSGIVELAIEGAAAAYQTNGAEGRQMHLFGKPQTLYFHVPEGVSKWDLMLSSAVPGETAKAIITAPDGKQAAILETTTVPTQSAALEGKAGFWKIEIVPAATGVLDDIYLIFDKDLSPWASVDPSLPLEVTPNKK